MGEKLLLENFMEVVVDEIIEDLMKVPSLDVCRCDRCFLDIKALALNHLPAKYVVSEKGNIYTKLDSFRNQVRVDVLKSVIEAIEVVQKHPSHPKGQPIFFREDFSWEEGDE
ncbi:MAG TPA: late competence development ComFB family protein [Thermotogota bacterium]|nr:late competence development ComFB family protein [Thermotogota bacterium]HRW91654.1 late competence development ComFB family protein [Thermotogota bacterium]